MKIAILGFGVVGSGVAEVLNQNRSSIAKKANEEIELARILEIRNVGANAFSKYMTNDPEVIFKDKTIGIIAETIGGTSYAYEYTKRALMSGKHVVTSNKELVAGKGPELLALAKENRCNYLFEASVGGGIPIIRPLEQCLAANEISMVAGILNGTTNYILTKMRDQGLEFETALKQARENGYAETDPTEDIRGFDTRRKIAILSSIAFGRFVNYEKIPVKGIEDIDIYDIAYARSLNARIKLIGMSRRNNGSVYAQVEPLLINEGDYLSSVDDVFNAILVRGDAIGDAMFYGRGAGKLPTASAVIADIIYIARNIKTTGGYDWSESFEITGDDQPGKYFLRIKGKNYAEAEKLAAGKIIAGIRDNEFGIVTEDIARSDLKELGRELDLIKTIKYI